MDGSAVRQARRKVAHGSSQKRKQADQKCMKGPTYNHMDDFGQPLSRSSDRPPMTMRSPVPKPIFQALVIGTSDHHPTITSTLVCVPSTLAATGGHNLSTIWSVGYTEKYHVGQMVNSGITEGRHMGITEDI